MSPNNGAKGRSSMKTFQSITKASKMVEESDMRINVAHWELHEMGFVYGKAAADTNVTKNMFMFMMNMFLVSQGFQPLAVIHCYFFCES